MSRFRIVAIVALLLLPAGLAHAQGPEATIPAGARIRVRSPDSAPVVGSLTLGGPDGRALVTASGDTLPLSRYALANVEVSRGRHPNPWRGAMFGAIAGGAAGLVVAALEDNACDSCDMDFGAAVYPI